MSLHENISSLYDDELDATERDPLLTSLKQDEEQKQIWGRYSLIGDAIRKDLPDNPNHDLLSRVQMALESEPALLAPSSVSSSDRADRTRNQTVNDVNVVELPKKASNDHFFKPVAGFAVAASVALASVLGFQMFSQPVDDFTQPAIAVASPSTQELDLTPFVETTSNVASVSHGDADEPVSEFDDAIYAQQSLMDDGQWTRITRIGNILLDNNILSQPTESHVNVDLRTGVIPFAKASNLETVKPE